MIEDSSNKWFEEIMEGLKKDPQCRAEYFLLDLGNEICKIHGQPKGIYWILFYLLNWSADKLIWR